MLDRACQQRDERCQLLFVVFGEHLRIHVRTRSSTAPRDSSWHFVDHLHHTDDPRRARADADWREILDRIPPWIVSHPYNDLLGDGLPECERTWAFDFRAMNPSAWWRVPVTIQNFAQDHHAQYTLHRMMLQHIQYTRPPKRWVLKGFHGRRLRALFDTYPDARIVWVHRDPVQVLASQIVAFGQINESLAGTMDWRRYAEATIEGSRTNFHAYLTDGPLVTETETGKVTQ